MIQIRSYGDRRILRDCFHCGCPATTVDHIPPKVLLDKPYPQDLTTVPSCEKCNNLASIDESYLACLVECAVTGEVNSSGVSRPAIAAMLEHSPALSAQMAASRRNEGQGYIFTPDIERVKKTVVKLARGHASYELHEEFFEEPDFVSFVPLQSLEDKQREQFEKSPDFSKFAMWPEVGSRAMQRMAANLTHHLVEGAALNDGWIVVQEGRYRYLASVNAGRVVRIVLSEYLACEVVWN